MMYGNRNRYLLTSRSAIKKEVVEKHLEGSPVQLDCNSIPSNQIEENVEQPVGIGGLICCKNRILATLKKDPTIASQYVAIISIENSIDWSADRGCWDEVHIMIYSTQQRVFYYEHGCPVYFKQMYWDMALTKSNVSKLGWSYTVGEAMQNCQLVQDHKNWMIEVGCIKQKKLIDRRDQISNVFVNCFQRFGMGSITQTDIYANIGYDFKFKKGIVFQDLGPIMSNSALFGTLIYSCVTALNNAGITQVDYIVGVGVRGFYLGPLLCSHFGAGFVPIRKQNKLPGDVICNQYTTEYSSDIMEIQPSLIPREPNQKVFKTVLVVDDLVATGGSLKSACNLIHSFGKDYLQIVGCFCPLKVDELIPQAKRILECIGESGIELITL